MSYVQVVQEFRSLTGSVWPDSGRCCEKVRYGAPECCYQIIDGAELTFTRQELAWLPVTFGASVRQREDGMFVLNRAVWGKQALIRSLRDGILADTLECASHPTRPLLDEHGIVVGVVLINGCNTALALESYRQKAGRLQALWMEAVHRWGSKPYYALVGMEKSDWIVVKG